ncbi:hypothetical protein ACWC2T_28305 [Streptomyces sp. NPDC001393]
MCRASLVQLIRTAGGTDALTASLEAWERKLTAQGLAMLRGTTRLDVYLGLLNLA